MNYKIDRKTWAERDIFDQLGNISSEVGRAIASNRQHDDKRRDGAIYRALDMFDATAEVLAAKQSPRLKEVLRSRELLLGLFYNGRFEDDAEGIEAYFMQFAIAARNRRHIANS